jgi:hypothetical protein
MQYLCEIGCHSTEEEPEMFIGPGVLLSSDLMSGKPESTREIGRKIAEKTSGRVEK